MRLTLDLSRASMRGSGLLAGITLLWLVVLALVLSATMAALVAAAIEGCGWLFCLPGRALGFSARVRLPRGRQ